MKVTEIPDNLFVLDNILYKKMSPSVFTSVKTGCAFQNVLYRVDIEKNSNSIDYNSFLLPISNNALIGTIIHKMFEFRSNGEINSNEDFINCWDKAIFQKEEEIIIKNGHLKHGFLINHLKKFQAMKSVLSVPILSKKVESNIFTSQINLSKTSEVGIWDVDYLHGTIDKIVYNGNEIEIIDYKTGRIFDNDECISIKEDYVVQLKLYAVLFEKKFNKIVHSLAIIDLSGNKTQIEFNHKDLIELYEQVKVVLNELNNKISAQNWESLHKIDEQRCPNCICRSACNFYWGSGIVSEHDIQGNLINVFDNGVIEIRTDNNIQIRVKDIMNYESQDLKLFKDHKIRIMNIYLLREVASIKIYIAKEWTRIYATI